MSPVAASADGSSAMSCCPWDVRRCSPAWFKTVACGLSFTELLYRTEIVNSTYSMRHEQLRGVRYVFHRGRDRLPANPAAGTYCHRLRGRPAGRDARGIPVRRDVFLRRRHEPREHPEIPERASREHEGSSRHRRPGISQSVDGPRRTDLRQCRTPRSPGRPVRTGPLHADYAHRFLELEPGSAADHTQPEDLPPARRARSCGRAKRIAEEVHDEW